MHLVRSSSKSIKVFNKAFRNRISGHHIEWGYDPVRGYILYCIILFYILGFVKIVDKDLPALKLLSAQEKTWNLWPNLSSLIDSPSAAHHWKEEATTHYESYAQKH